MRLFDTHAHLEDEQLQPHIESFLSAAQGAGLVGIASVGTTLASSLGCVELAARFSEVHAAVGIHPNHAHEAVESDWAAICQLANRSEVVAIGETGLDRHWDYCPIELQREWFARHIELSYEVNKPLVIHTRDCESDMLEMLDAHRQTEGIIGIMHSFAGSWEAAKQCLDWGMYLSFAGMITFKKSTALREIAARIPDNRLLIETDSPYLSPHPHRSQRPNHPAMLRFTAASLAETRGISVEQLGALTTANAARVFGLDG